MASDGEDFDVAWWVDRLSGHIERNPGLWIKAGNLETRILGDDLAATSIKAPIYVAGLARSGSTFLLEALATHPDTATHRYKDFPPVFTPFWWHKFLSFMPQKEPKPTERAHKDGIKITEDSPEAFEEPVWSAFFDHLHNPDHNALLDGRTTNPAFEKFYREHIQKLLTVRGARRYLSKGNYNLTRLAYLQKIFPDARFVLPIRAPAWHIASLIKQHRLFCTKLENNPKAQAHMRRVGHFEFGLDRRPIRASDDQTIEVIQTLWRQGKEIEGQARYWAYLHGTIIEQLSAHPALRDATLIVRYEQLCEHPGPTLETLFAHCCLDGVNGAMLDELADRVQHPTYYEPDFSSDERRLIDEITGPVVAQFDRLGAGGHAAAGDAARLPKAG